jgi:ribonuclease Z
VHRLLIYCKLVLVWPPPSSSHQNFSSSLFSSGRARAPHISDSSVCLIDTRWAECLSIVWYCTGSTSSEKQRIMTIIIITMPDRMTSTSCSGSSSTRRKHHKRRREGGNSFLRCALFCAYIFSPAQNQKSRRSIIASPMTVSYAFMQPLLPNEGYAHRQKSILQLATEPNINIDTLKRSTLEKMTVKELKSYIADNNILIPRGESSNLKLKKDIVDFIWSQSNNSDGSSTPIASSSSSDDDRPEEEAASTTSSSATPKKHNNRKKLPIGTGMPPLPEISDSNDGDDDDNDSSYVLTPKDRIVLEVLDRYPPLHDAIVDACSLDSVLSDGITPDNIEHCELNSLVYNIPSGMGENDMRHVYHPMLANATQTDMDVVFVGTASCTPGVTRGVSCTAIRLNWRNNREFDQMMNGGEKNNHDQQEQQRRSTGGTWLFDCGESTQLSVQKTSSIKPGKISKIFITHCHGDHSFGLPGLLCLMGTDRDRDAPPIEIYGPEGLRMWLRVAIRYSVSRVVPPYRVHELMDVPMAPEWEEGHRRNGRFYYQLKNEGKRGMKWGTKGLAGEDTSSWISRAPMVNLDPNKDFGEVNGGQDIYPVYDHPQSTDGAPVWEVLDDGGVSVFAAPMSHGVPCLGYVVQEDDRPGRLMPENVLPVIERNRKALVESGVRNPMKLMALVKNLPVGGSYTFPDGTILHQEDVVEPPGKGRKVVICGDTADCRAIEGLAQDCDVLIHEATNTFLPGVDKEGNLRLVTRDAKIHGHSTPFMAGDFAKRVRAKRLVLNHFSARYKGDQSIESLTIMTRMERQAMKACELPENAVACAWDFMVLPVPRK